MLQASQTREDSRSKRRSLMQFVQKRVRDPDLSDDIVQETIIRLMRYQEPVVHWMALAQKIATNLIYDHYRQTQLYAYEDLNEAIACQNPLPEQVLFYRQRIQYVSDILATMPQKRRDVLMRRRLLGESYQTISTALRISPEAVEKHMTRALHQLRAMPN